MSHPIRYYINLLFYCKPYIIIMLKHILFKPPLECEQSDSSDVNLLFIILLHGYNCHFGMRVLFFFENA